MVNDNLFPGMGLADPHAIVENGRVYIFCGHDQSPLTEDYCRMDKWYIISSDNLKDWKIEGEIDPRDTYMTQYDQCWAGDIAKKGDKYYWYFSNKNIDTGVMVSDNITGPFKDALGRPLLPHDIVPVNPYDPTIYCENNEYYIIFGAGHYYIAKLGEDMISLAEEPQRIMLYDEKGNIRGNGDKSTLFKRNGKYYLCWGDKYAMSDHLKGPYIFKGRFLGGGHNDVFTFKGQDYVCSEFHDINVFYRGIRINVLNFNEDGTVKIPDDDESIRPSYKFWDFNFSSGGWHYKNNIECEVKDGKMFVDVGEDTTLLSAKWVGMEFRRDCEMKIKLYNQNGSDGMNVRIQTIEYEECFWRNNKNKIERSIDFDINLKPEKDGMQEYTISLKPGENLRPIIKRITLTPKNPKGGKWIFDYIHIK